MWLQMPCVVFWTSFTAGINALFWWCAAKWEGDLTVPGVHKP